ncbi:hypothetical protein FHT97_004144 [Rhizobium sp. BK399]|nr:hypothetical protein [Rhizobium sp. BK399]MCS3743552.1 hypothetical protein [Rhizobium sp. BK661]
MWVPGHCFHGPKLLAHPRTLTWSDLGKVLGSRHAPGVHCKLCKVQRTQGNERQVLRLSGRCHDGRRLYRLGDILVFATGMHEIYNFVWLPLDSLTGGSVFMVRGDCELLHSDGHVAGGDAPASTSKNLRRPKRAVKHRSGAGGILRSSKVICTRTLPARHRPRRHCCIICLTGKACREAATGLKEMLSCTTRTGVAARRGYIEQPPVRFTPMYRLDGTRKRVRSWQKRLGEGCLYRQ